MKRLAIVAVLALLAVLRGDIGIERLPASYNSCAGNRVHCTRLPQIPPQYGYSHPYCITV